jgi:hypothetical protein
MLVVSTAQEKVSSKVNPGARGERMGQSLCLHGQHAEHAVWNVCAVYAVPAVALLCIATATGLLQ